MKTTADNTGKKAAIKQLASDLGAKYIDIYAIAPKNEDGTMHDGFLSDTVHPTDYGHRFIAEHVARSIGLSCTSKMMALDVFGLRL
jgi:lysophospholipase L1-like esterase